MSGDRRLQRIHATFEMQQPQIFGGEKNAICQTKIGSPTTTKHRAQQYYHKSARRTREVRTLGLQYRVHNRRVSLISTTIAGIDGVQMRTSRIATDEGVSVTSGVRETDERSRKRGRGAKRLREGLVMFESRRNCGFFGLS
jgi:hypothetical protein